MSHFGGRQQFCLERGNENSNDVMIIVVADLDEKGSGEVKSGSKSLPESLTALRMLWISVVLPAPSQPVRIVNGTGTIRDDF